MKQVIAILGGVGVGAALMYLLDPDRGNSRRSLIQDKATTLKNNAQKAFNTKTADFRNKAKGLLHETKSALNTENQTAEKQTA